MDIILNQEQADTVRGRTALDGALLPVPLADGVTWILPEAVLSDQAHAEHFDFLDGLTTRVVTSDEYLTPELPE